MRTSIDQRFEKGDPVREYWLAHGEGFSVETRRGRVVGQVVDTVLDPGEGRIVSLVVRSTLLGAVPVGTTELPAERVQAAVPARGAFVVDGANREPVERRRPQRPRVAAPRLRAPRLRAPRVRAPRMRAPRVRVPLHRLEAPRRQALTAAAGARDGLGVAARRSAPVAREAGVVLRELAVAVVLWVAGLARWSVSAVRLLARRARSELQARMARPSQ